MILKSEQTDQLKQNMSGIIKTTRRQKVQNILIAAFLIYFIYHFVAVVQSNSKLKYELIRVENHAARETLELKLELNKLINRMNLKGGGISNSENNFENQKSVTSEAEKSMVMSKLDLSMLKQMRKIWQVTDSDIMEKDDSDNSDPTEPELTGTLSLNTYLSAWLFTMDLVTRASGALKQMIEPLNLSICDLAAFSINPKFFENFETPGNENDNIGKIILNDPKNDIQKNFLSEIGSTYRILDLISKIQKALASENDRSEPAVLAFEAYKQSSVAVRHGWVMKNSIKLGMKVSLPSLQSELALQLAGVDDPKNLSKRLSISQMEYALEAIFDEFEVAVGSMEQVHNYLYPVLEADGDDKIYEKINEPSLFTNDIILTNETNSYRSICGVEWLKEVELPSNPERVTFSNLYTEEKKDSEMDVGSYCRVSLCST